MSTRNEPAAQPVPKAGMHGYGEDGGSERPLPSRARALCLRLQCSEAELQDALAAVGPDETALARHIEFVRGLTALLRATSERQSGMERRP